MISSNNKIAYRVLSDNHTVTDFYIDVISSALGSIGYSVYSQAEGNWNLDKRAPVVVADVLTMQRWYFRGFRNFILWSQGTVPDESYMRRKSKMKRYILSKVESWGLKNARINLFVSEAQRDYFSEKYKYDFSKNSCIMPCYNCEMNEVVFETPHKYEKDIFAYTGSFVAPWQYVEGNMAFYKEIESKYGDKVFLKIFTPDKEIAQRKMVEMGIRNYSIDCVPSNELPHALKDVKYGLLLREDNIVNNIATPTKLSTYISCGMIPVVSDCIKDYASSMKGRPYFVLVRNPKDTLSVEELISHHPKSEDVRNDLTSYWKEHYDTERYIKGIASLIQERI